MGGRGEGTASQVHMVGGAQDEYPPPVERTRVSNEWNIYLCWKYMAYTVFGSTCL